MSRFHTSGLFSVFIFLSVQVIAQSTQSYLADPNATPETRALFDNLYKLSEHYVMFGHQHATEYGHTWVGDKNRSDVKDVCGSHPAVIGVDLINLSNRPEKEIKNRKKKLIKTIVDAYDRGAVITCAWHYDNPASAGSFYWVDTVSIPAMKSMGPGGAHHEAYKKDLRMAAEVFSSVKGKNGTLAPIIFRPFHEQDGDWFWWGKSHCTREEFIEIWQFTVNYLRDTLGVHNLLYAFTPDCTYTTEEEFLERYPGDHWVDMVGMDNYADFGRDEKYNLPAALHKLKIASNFAKKSGKLVALTETGLEGIPDQGWWTDSLLGTIQKEQLKLAFVLVWRNAHDNPEHHYAPFPGHASVADFMNFYNHPVTLFENDLKAIYKPHPEPLRPVEKHGALSVKGTKLTDSSGKTVVLHGMSFGWHNLWPRFYNDGAVRELTEKWKCTIVRAALGIELNDSGYLVKPHASERLIRNVIESAIRENVYVIIDWHDHNIHLKEAIDFFSRMAKDYGHHPHVIYEIFNEPDYETWPEVKAYSIEVIKAIRQHDPDNIILVGSPRWDQDVHLPAADPIRGYDNLMYTMHFYAATHKQELRDRTEKAIKDGLPIFVSECAAMEATGDGPLNEEEWNRWVEWMDKLEISWVAWSVSDKNETCSVLKPGASSRAPWPDAVIKPYGFLARDYLLRYHFSGLLKK